MVLSSRRSDLPLAKQHMVHILLVTVWTRRASSARRAAAPSPISLVNIAELQFSPLLCLKQLLQVPAKTSHSMGVYVLPDSVSDQLRALRPKHAVFLGLGQ